MTIRRQNGILTIHQENKQLCGHSKVFFHQKQADTEYNKTDLVEHPEEKTSPPTREEVRRQAFKNVESLMSFV